jgi:hypothetical protein
MSRLRRWVRWTLAIWTLLVLLLYALSVAATCMDPDQDCGTAVGLGALAAAMIWVAGVVPLGVAAAIDRLTLPRCPRCGARRPRGAGPCRVCGAPVG